MENNNISKAISTILERVDNSSLSDQKKKLYKDTLEIIKNNSTSMALIALSKEVLKYNYPEGVKNALNKLLEILSYYYVERYLELVMDNNHLIEFSSRMTDYIVAINDTVNGKNDVFCVVNAIYKEINYDDKKGVFKRKRLI